MSTSTAESEIKAVNHTLKFEIISNQGILNAIEWKQGPTIIEEDNQACVYASEAKHMTRNLHHLDLATEEQKFECSKYPYRRVVGQLMYGMVHTMTGIALEP